MIFDRNDKKQVVALLGAGSMGTAIVRRIAAGKKVLLGDISEKALERVSDDFRRSGYDVETQVVNALEKESVEAFAKKAAELGPVMYFIDTAGASPNQASPEHIVNLDMVGTGYAVDAFGQVMAEGGAGLIISSQAAYMYPIPNEDELQIVNATTEQLPELPIVKNVALQNSGPNKMIVLPGETIIIGEMNEKQEIEAFIRERNKAMCDQDTLKLGRMMADDLMLVHMSGARQSKTSWLKDIADGTMRYYNIDMKKLEITVNGDYAVARMTSSIEARIWGSHGTWTVPSTMHLRKTEGGWLWTNE